MERKENLFLRSSNFELMRIISMFMIVVWHFIIHGGVLNKSVGLTNLFFTAVTAVIYIHVNSFVLLSGYFNHDKKFKLSKVIKLNNSVWFYKALIMIIFLIFGLSLTKMNILHTLSPISFNDYWFFTSYLILFLISPILNMVIENCDKFKLRKIIILLFIVVSILPIITLNLFYNAQNGYSVSNFILLYFIGAYLNKYPISYSYYMKNFSINMKRVIFITLFFFMAILNFLFNYLGNGLLGLDSSLTREIGSIFTNAFLAYNNPLLILQSICYFMLFQTFVFSNKYINKIASASFGVYLLTDNIYVRPWLYNVLGFTKEVYSIKIVIYIILFSMSIFIVCTIFELLRLKVFDFIYNSKLAIFNRKVYQKFLKSLGFNINF